jgi:hypothetical protein
MIKLGPDQISFLTTFKGRFQDFWGDITGDFTYYSSGEGGFSWQCVYESNAICVRGHPAMSPADARENLESAMHRAYREYSTLLPARRSVVPSE